MPIDEKRWWTKNAALRKVPLALSFFFVAPRAVDSQPSNTQPERQVASSTMTQRYQDYLDAARRDYNQWAQGYKEWEREVVRKGRRYPKTLHAWLAECGETYDKLGAQEAEQYCLDRKMRTQRRKIHARLELHGGLTEDQRKRLKNLEVDLAPESKGKSVEVKLPFAAIRDLAAESGVDFIRPLPAEDEKTRHAEYMKGWRTRRTNAVEWHHPVKGKKVTVKEGHVSVRFRRGVSIERAHEILYSYGCWLLDEDYPGRFGVFCQRSKAMDEILLWLGNDPDITFVQPSYLGTYELIPNDPEFPNQWHLHNLGATQGGVGKFDADIDAPEGWDRTVGGSGVVVAIIDSGLDPEHPDLASKLWASSDLPNNGVDDDLNGFKDDVFGWDFGRNIPNPVDVVDFGALGKTAGSGHGTGVAGITAAATDNSRGVAGVAWNVRLMILRTSNDFVPNCNNLPSAVRYARLNGARVINLSFSCPVPSGDIDNELFFAYQAGIVIVGAAGNSGLPEVAYPARNFTVIAVGASNTLDERLASSNYGLGLALVAPGENILSTSMCNDFLLGHHECYGQASGTSQAAPQVAGAAAIVLSVLPGASPDDVRQLLTSNADPLDGFTSDPHWTFELGWGRLNLGRVIQAAIALTENPPPPPPAPVITSPPTASGTVGSAFTYQITASNSPTNFNAVGLPVGLSVFQPTGFISGTPAEAGTSTVTISASNASGTGSANLVLTIAPQPVSVSIGAPNNTVKSGGTLQFSAAVTGSTTTAVVWAASTGTISNTGLYMAPAVSTNTQVTVTATSVADPTKFASVTVTVTPPPPPPTPAISRLFPAFAVAGGQAFTLVVTGSNFGFARARRARKTKGRDSRPRYASSARNEASSPDPKDRHVQGDDCGSRHEGRWRAG